MKLVIVMRKDLNMRKGKMVAQGGHAVQRALLDVDAPHVKEYIHGPGRWVKICVGVDSLEELNNVLDMAERHEVPSGMIEDAGLTEFDGVPTITCAYVGPYNEEDVDKVTGQLKLL